MGDSTLNVLVHAQAFLTLAAGALLIANYRLGGFLLSLAMFLTIATRDNPLLATTDFYFRSNLHNMLKDLAIAGMGILFFIRKQTVKHRKRHLE
jgi:hypothetical protein